MDTPVRIINADFIYIIDVRRLSSNPKVMVAWSYKLSRSVTGFFNPLKHNTVMPRPKAKMINYVKASSSKASGCGKCSEFELRSCFGSYFAKVLTCTIFAHVEDAACVLVGASQFVIVLFSTFLPISIHVRCFHRNYDKA